METRGKVEAPEMKDGLAKANLLRKPQARFFDSLNA